MNPTIIKTTLEMLATYRDGLRDIGFKPSVLRREIRFVEDEMEIWKEEDRKDE